MITRGCGVFGLIAAAMLFPWTPDYASAADEGAADFVQITKSFKLKPKPPVNLPPEISGKVNVNQKFSSISSVCLGFVFVGDLLDPGEEVSLHADNAIDGPAFFNPGPAPQSERTLCYSDIFNPEAVSLFLDGKQDMLITMSNGSVTISSLSITITGYSR